VVNSADELKNIFSQLSKGGTPVPNSYPGTMVQLPDGTLVGLREVSKSGGPTIDIFGPNDVKLKIHVTQ
jgi:hypothetical protein